MKVCTKCHKNKGLNSFNKDKCKKGGHASQCKDCTNEWARKYYKENKEILNARSKKWKFKNKEHIKAYRKKYNEANKKALSIQHTKYTLSRLHSDLNYKLAHYLRTRIYDALRKNYKVGSAVEDLGCSIEEFRQYITDKFQEGMSWENYGEWHLDHIKPLISFDLTDRAQFLEACHYTNYQPLWAIDNLRKRKEDLRKRK